MYKTKYEVSLRPNTECLKSSPRSPALQLSAQIINCPACSAARWCSGHNLEILGRGPPGPFCGWGTLAGPCGCRSWVRISRELCGQPIAATLLVASKISLQLLWWPPTEHQCELIYRCVLIHVCCWLFSVGNKVTTTTNTFNSHGWTHLIVRKLLGRVGTVSIVKGQRNVSWRN